MQRELGGIRAEDASAEGCQDRSVKLGVAAATGVGLSHTAGLNVKSLLVNLSPNLPAQSSSIPARAEG